MFVHESEARGISKQTGVISPGYHSSAPESLEQVVLRALFPIPQSLFVSSRPPSSDEVIGCCSPPVSSKY
jgi:hypothetical protein